MNAREPIAELQKATHESVDQQGIAVDDIGNIDAARTADWHMRRRMHMHMPVQLEIEWQLLYDRLDQHLTERKKAKENADDTGKRTKASGFTDAA